MILSNFYPQEIKLPEPNKSFAVTCNSLCEELNRLGSATNLKEIDWAIYRHDQQLTDEGVEKIKKLLTINKDIKKINLNGELLCRIHEIVMARILQPLSKLRSINLRYSGQRIQLSPEFMCYLKENKNLASFSIHNNFFTENDAIKLFEAVATNNNISFVRVTGRFDERKVGRLLEKIVISSPHFSLCGIMYGYSCGWAGPESRTLSQIVNQNLNIKYRLQGKPFNTDYSSCSFHVGNHVRCYNEKLKDLDCLFWKLSMLHESRCVTSIFVYNTPLTYEWLTKWFNSDGMGEKVETLVLIKCDISEGIFAHYNEFFSNFPVLKNVNISDYKDVA